MRPLKFRKSQLMKPFRVAIGPDTHINWSRWAGITANLAPFICCCFILFYKKHQFNKRHHMPHYFITGASAGIGMALSRQLTSDRHHVTGLARRLAPMAELAAEHDRFLGITGDVTSPDDLNTAVARASAQHGPIDVAILNAGIYTPVDASAGIDVDIFDRHMQVNYQGVVNALAAVLPDMIARGQGHVVIVASVAGWVGLPRAAAYSPTKAALISLAESLWFDLTPKGIKVQVICPGFVETEATAVNDFDMPGLMTSDAAALAMIKGMASSSFEVAFPKGFSRMMRMLKFLPYSLYFNLMKRRTGQSCSHNKETSHADTSHKSH